MSERGGEIDAKQMLDLIEHKEFVVQTVVASGSKQHYSSSLLLFRCSVRNNNLLFAVHVKFMFLSVQCLTAEVWTLFMGQENSGFDTNTHTHDGAAATVAVAYTSDAHPITVMNFLP